jgi:protein SCO1/2
MPNVMKEPRQNMAQALQRNLLHATCVVALVIACWPLHAQSQQPAAMKPALLQNVGMIQKMNENVPLDLAFRDEAGNSVRLGDYFGSKPVVLSLVYYNCPSMCTEVLNGELRALQGISLDLGKDYEAVTVSFDPKDRPAEAAVKKRTYTGLYGHRGSPSAWHFLTGEQRAIDALTEAVGFKYAYDASSAQFAHATAIVILTPDGRISRYFYGVQYPSRDVRLGLVEASQGRIGSATDAALLFCYHYDAVTGKYGLVIMNVIRAAGVLTLALLGIFFWFMSRHEKKRVAAADVMEAGLR